MAVIKPEKVHRTFLWLNYCSSVTFMWKLSGAFSNIFLSLWFYKCRIMVILIKIWLDPFTKRRRKLYFIE